MRKKTDRQRTIDNKQPNNQTEMAETGETAARQTGRQAERERRGERDGERESARACARERDACVSVTNFQNKLDLRLSLKHVLELHNIFSILAGVNIEFLS